MSAANPENVPKVTDMQWSYAPKESSSSNQQYLLQMLLTSEGINPAELYGNGFLSISELSKWAAHWGITLLESRTLARSVNEAREQVEENIEQQMKAYVGNFFRRKAAGSA
jgi:hypothetical protein